VYLKKLRGTGQKAGEIVIGRDFCLNQVNRKLFGALLNKQSGAVCAVILAIIVFPILLVNCGKDEMGQGSPDNTRVPGHVSLPDQAMSKEALRSLVEADRLWSKAASEGDFEGFVSFLDEKVVWFFAILTSFDPETEHSYSTVWRRKGGGDWKVVLETDF
jgi:hypothetical protein